LICAWGLNLFENKQMDDEQKGECLRYFTDVVDPVFRPLMAMLKRDRPQQVIFNKYKCLFHFSIAVVLIIDINQRQSFVSM